jgi:hypothetical protein
LSGPRRRTGLRRSFALVIGFVALIGPVATVHATTTWAKNLYVSSALVYQDPYGTACTAASTMTMLNTIAYRHTGGAGFVWTPYRVKNSTNRADVRDLTSILSFERAHDTLSGSGAGSDAHGWRNALNYYGWGSKAMTDPASRVYQSLAYGSFDSAVHGAVRAIARFGMPVGILSWAGRHAQVMTGYVVDGADPTTSDAFVVRYVYITDPLYLQHHVNYRLSNTSFKSGLLALRFQSYRETDSPYDDPYTTGWKRSAVSPTVAPSEWYRRWVIVAPVRIPAAAPPPPPPDPSPSPSSTPSPDPTPTPQPTAAVVTDATPPPDPTSTPNPDPTPTTEPTATAASEPTPTPDPTSATSPSASPPDSPASTAP